MGQVSFSLAFMLLKICYAFFDHMVSNMYFFISHHNIWRDAQVPQRTFHYYHPESRGLDFAGLMDDVKVGITYLNP